MKPVRRIPIKNKLAWANLALVMLVIAAERLPGERWWPTLLLAYAPQGIWAVPSILLAGYFVFRKRWISALSTFAIVGLVATVLMGAPIPHKQPVEPSDVRILTWNLWYGRGGPSVADLALDTSADIICLQEANPWADRNLAKVMQMEQFKGWQSTQCGELVILSRFPLKRLKTTNSVLWASVKVNGQEVWIADAHLALPVSSNPREMLDPSKLYSDELRRRPQVRGLIENLPLEHPVIVCGDFNTPPNTEVYRKLSSVMINSFSETGGGLGLSYPKRLPLVRIDHIFVRQAKPIRCWLPEVDASNHYPMCADLKLPEVN